MVFDQIDRARELASIVERVHGPDHPEMTRVRELTERIADGRGQADVFAELRALTNDYAPPAGTCETVGALYSALAAADPAR